MTYMDEDPLASVAEQYPDPEDEYRDPDKRARPADTSPYGITHYSQIAGSREGWRPWLDNLPPPNGTPDQMGMIYE